MSRSMTTAGEPGAPRAEPECHAEAGHRDRYSRKQDHEHRAQEHAAREEGERPVWAVTDVVSGPFPRPHSDVWASACSSPVPPVHERPAGPGRAYPTNTVTVTGKNRNRARTCAPVSRSKVIRDGPTAATIRSPAPATRTPPPSGSDGEARKASRN